MLLDALGCGHLARGEWAPAMVLLGHCLENDPGYAAAFVHVGDGFLARWSEVQSEDRPGFLRDARMSYGIARRLDQPRRGTGTHLQRLITDRLAEVDRLEQYPRDSAKPRKAPPAPRVQPPGKNKPMNRVWAPPAVLGLANTRFEIWNAGMGRIAL
jgi:hypothetical protein